MYVHLEKVKLKSFLFLLILLHHGTVGAGFGMGLTNVVVGLEVSEDGLAVTADHLSPNSKPAESVLNKLFLGVVDILVAVEAGQTSACIKLVDVGPKAPGGGHRILFNVSNIAVNRSECGTLTDDAHGVWF